MNDLTHWFSGDMSASSGDFAVSTGGSLTQQRIIRRVMTAPGDYIWNPDYGCGAPEYVGATSSDFNELKARIISQMQYEPGVDSSVTPDVTFTTQNGVLNITIKYVDSSTGSTEVLSFPAGGAQ